MPLRGIACSPLFRVFSTQLARFSHSPTLPSNHPDLITCPVAPARRFKPRNRPLSRHPPTNTSRRRFEGWVSWILGASAGFPVSGWTASPKRKGLKASGTSARPPFKEPLGSGIVFSCQYGQVKSLPQRAGPDKITMRSGATRLADYWQDCLKGGTFGGAMAKSDKRHNGT